MLPAVKRPVTSHGRDKHVIAVLVFPETHGLEIAIAQQIFGQRVPTLAAVSGDEESPYEIVLVGEEERYVLPNGSDPGELAPIESLLTADTVLVPGLEAPLAPRSEKVLDTLRLAQEGGARMVAFCGGAFILGLAGVLDGRRATTHWVLKKEFAEAFPLVRLEAEHLYVNDGDVHTSSGVFSATDLSLHLLALDLGQAYANDFRRLMVSSPHRPGGQSQFTKDSIRLDDEPATESLLRWLRDNIHEPLTLAQLAAREHVSERTLARRFHQDTGMSVFDWITQERVNQAKALLETTEYRVSEIAAMVGMGSSESLRRNFDKLIGTTASAYRLAFRPDTANRTGAVGLA